MAANCLIAYKAFDTLSTLKRALRVDTLGIFDTASVFAIVAFIYVVAHLINET